MTDTMTLDEKLERFAVLRDTIQGLEAEKDELGREIKEAMLAGAKPECDLYRARLQPFVSETYTVERFREVYGDAAAFEVAVINTRKVKELVKSGDLDGKPLSEIVEVSTRHALYLVPKTKDAQPHG